MGKQKKRSVIQSRKAQIKAMRLKGQESLMAKKSYYKAQKSAKINFKVGFKLYSREFSNYQKFTKELNFIEFRRIKFKSYQRQ